ncbi:MAG TPA: DUF6496 domain-containing protein [Xanthobacteraceae bacterium]|jgi:hypothetical protein|nr:DUF6496 domain-containing protein [Xanthobacteraceae bacterium]
MPDKKTIEKAKRDKRDGKSPSTQAGEFVRAEIDKIRQGEHGARSAKQAVAIGLSEARRAGVDLPPPRRGATKARTRKSARYAYEIGQGKRKAKSPSRRRSRAALKALKREPGRAASHRALSRQARGAAKRRSAMARSRAAQKAARTKGRSERAAASGKAARRRRA